MLLAASAATDGDVVLVRPSISMNVQDDAPWKAPEMKTRSLTREVMDVSDVKVTDESGPLLTNRVARQIVLQALPPDRPARSTFSLCILTLAPNLHLEFYWRTVTDGTQSPWHLRLDVVSKCSQHVDHRCEEN